MTSYEISKDLFCKCEAGASNLLTALAAGDEIDLDEVGRGLGACLEYVLSALFETLETDRGYWVDGVLVDKVELQSPKTIGLEGRAWCTKGARNEQWHIPAQVVFAFSEDESQPRLQHLHIRVGDADFGSLGDHRSWRERHRIERWLLTFRVLRPPDLSCSDPK